MKLLINVRTFSCIFNIDVEDTNRQRSFTITVRKKRRHLPYADTYARDRIVIYCPTPELRTER